MTDQFKEERSRRYARWRYFFALLSLGLGLSYLLVMLKWGTFPLKRLAEGLFRGRYSVVAFYSLLFFLLYNILELPISFLEGFWLERRFNLSEQPFARWLWTWFKKMCLSLLLLLILVQVVYLGIDRFGSNWWIWASIAWFGATVVIGRVFPQMILPLFYKKVPVDDPELLERFRALAKGTGLSIHSIYRIDLSRSTRKANAALAGWGSTRQVLLGDTLLEKFTSEEIGVVFAHELAHHLKGHIPKMLFAGALVASSGFLAASEILRRLSSSLGLAGPSDIAAFPLLCLVLTITGLVMLPLQNMLSRQFERSSDLYALRRSDNPRAFKSAFLKFAMLNLSEVKPNPLIKFLFHSHPSIGERIRMAERYERRKGKKE